MMKRIWALPAAARERYDLSSLRVVWHLAEPCPPWLKDAWIGWLGPERIYELYGGTEGQLATIITGKEWLEHRGSVGRPIGGDVMVCDVDGNELPAGEMGELWLRSAATRPATGTSGRRPGRVKAAGSRSVTTGGSTPTATSTSATGWGT